MFAVLFGFRGLEELGQLDSARAARSLYLRAGSHGNESRRQRRWVDDDARMPLCEDGVIAVFAIGGVALAAAFEQAEHLLVPKIPAAVALAQVAAQRTHMADLRSTDVAGRYRQRWTASLENRVGGDVRQFASCSNLNLWRVGAAGADFL